MSLIRDRVVFDVAGSLTTSSGQLANFLRGSKAYAEYVLDGGLHLVEVSTHQPRFGNDGSLYLEPGATNYVRNPTDLGNSTVWVRGSHINIITNTATSMANTYEADRVTVTPGTGNVGRQTLKQDIVVPAGVNTFTVYLRLMGGTFGLTDVFKVSGNVEGGSQEVRLMDVYNNNPRRYLPISITTNVTGTSFGTVSLQLYVENTVSFDFSGATAAPVGYRTTFVDGLTSAPSRSHEYLAYERSPLEGLGSFVVYTNLLEWRGQGDILFAGNFRLYLEANKLKADLGGTVLSSVNNLEQGSKIAVRVNRSDNSAKLFVNNVLQAQATLANYTGARANFVLTPGGVRRFRNLFVLDAALTDGSPSLGSQAGGQIAELMSDESILLRQTEGRGIISFSSIRIKPRARAAIRLPQTQFAAGVVNNITVSNNHQPEIVLVLAERVIEPSLPQREWISINGNPPFEVTVFEPTLDRIAITLADAVNAEPRVVPVTAIMASGEPGFMLVADRPGNSFVATGSQNLSFNIVQANKPAENSLFVSAASDFRLGLARVLRNNIDVCDIVITNINQVTGELKFTCQPVALAASIKNGDVLFQADWRTNIAPGNYVVGIHETHLNEVKLSDKAIDGFAFENLSTRELVITPFIRVTV